MSQIRGQIQKYKEEYQPVIQKAPDNIFIVEIKNFTPGISRMRDLEFKTNRKN